MTVPETGGIRIIHRTARSAVVVVANPRRPYLGGGLVCPTCQTLHPVKTYHINVNADGAAIVSVGVFRGLEQAGAFSAILTGSGPVGIPPFQVDAHVPNPPKQTLGFDAGKFYEMKQRDKIALWHH